MGDSHVQLMNAHLLQREAVRAFVFHTHWIIYRLELLQMAANSTIPFWKASHSVLLGCSFCEQGQGSGHFGCPSLK